MCTVLTFYIFLQFALLETSSVDDDLASLKKELSGSTKVKVYNIGLLCTFFSSTTYACDLHIMWYLLQIESNFELIGNMFLAKHRKDSFHQGELLLPQTRDFHSEKLKLRMS